MWGAIDVKSMIILHLNAPTDEETDYEDADPASLQMMSQSYSPMNSEREADYLNL